MTRQPSKRKYDSSRRTEQATQNRLKIIEAGKKLFIEKGYAGATVGAIADEAGVSQETIYGTIGSKRGVLAAALEISVGGDGQPIRILDRPGPQAILEEIDQRQQLLMFSRDITTILARVAPIFQVMRSAAKLEDEIDEMFTQNLQERLQNLTKFAENLSSHGPLRDGMKPSKAGEIVWALTSPDLYQLVKVDLGWSNPEYSDWLADSLIRLLLP